MTVIVEDATEDATNSKLELRRGRGVSPRGSRRGTS